VRAVPVVCGVNDEEQDRFNLYRIEQELGTEIQPIPQNIDRNLYVSPAIEIGPSSSGQQQQPQQQNAPNDQDANRASQVRMYCYYFISLCLTPGSAATAAATAVHPSH
jgi:hypothetical protein